MLDWTDRHCRYFHRILTKQTLLYTEMVTTGAILHGDRNYLLGYNPEEHPVALQLGGSDPKLLAECSKIGAEFGYDEINLNVGCPSGRVQAGQFGASLMQQPQLVADCFDAMSNKVSVPVSVKTRIGIKGQDAYEDLHKFIEILNQANCKKIIIHARNADLETLTPKQNRTIPEIHYDYVYKIKQNFPNLNIIINGDIKTYDQIHEHLNYVDGVMLGREAYLNPYMLAGIDQEFYESDESIKTREQVLELLVPYITRELGQGIKITQITRHILGLYRETKGAKNWRRNLVENPESILTYGIYS